MALNVKHWLAPWLDDKSTISTEPIPLAPGVEDVAMGGNINDGGQMSKKDNPLRCKSIAPEKTPDGLELQCNWHSVKHGKSHMAVTHDHNAQDATLWYWSDIPIEPPKQLPAPIGSQCLAEYPDKAPEKACTLEKEHNGPHYSETDLCTFRWGWPAGGISVSEKD